MALRYLQVDDVTGKRKRLAALFTDTHFTVVGSPQTNFSVSGLTASNLVDVFVNGVMAKETDDYTRNVVANRIEWVSSVPINAKVRIRIWG